MNKAQNTRLFTSRDSGQGYRIGAVCECLFVNALTAEPFDINRSWGQFSFKNLSDPFSTCQGYAF